MAVMRTYECPECQGEFTHLHMDRNDPAPSYCPMCGNFVGTDPQPLPSNFKLVKGNFTKSMDQTYRAMEDSSNKRAEDAADMLGVSKNEMSHLKITDMKDNLREGDTSFKLPPSPATQVMAANPGRFGLQGPDAVQGYIQQAATGPNVGAGNAAREMISSGHVERAAVMQRQGEQGRFKRG